MTTLAVSSENMSTNMNLLVKICALQGCNRATPLSSAHWSKSYNGRILPGLYAKPCLFEEACSFTSLFMLARIFGSILFCR